MKSDEIRNLFTQFEAAASDLEGENVGVPENYRNY